MLQVPQNYTVPANPPTLHNPPISSDPAPNANGTVKDSITVFVSAILGYNTPLSISYFIRRLDQTVDPSMPSEDQTLLPAYGDTTLPLRIGTDIINLDANAPTWVIVNSGTSTSASGNTLTDSGHTWVVNAYVGLWLLMTSGPASGQYLQIVSNTTHTLTLSGSFSPTPTLGGGDTYQVTPLGWSGYIGNQDDNPLDYLTLTPNKVVGGVYQNPLYTYAPFNYVTLFINPHTIGGAIDPNHPPSYQVNLYAFDIYQNVYAACSFTLVVLPSTATYGLGVTAHSVSSVLAGTSTTVSSFQMTDNTQLWTSNQWEGYLLEYTTGAASGQVQQIFLNDATTLTTGTFHTTPANGDQYAILKIGAFVNSVSLKTNGGTTVDVVFQWYPIEPQVSAPVAVTVTANAFESRIIAPTNSTLDGVELGHSPFYIIPASFTRDFPSEYSHLHLELNATADATSADPTARRSAIEVMGMDENGVSATACIAISVIA